MQPSSPGTWENRLAWIGTCLLLASMLITGAMPSDAASRGSAAHAWWLWAAIAAGVVGMPCAATSIVLWFRRRRRARQ